MKLEYTEAQVAYEEAYERLHDTKLQTRVASYLGDIWPRGFEDARTPRSVFAPYLAKGSVFEVDYIETAAKVGFQPVIATYSGTEYVTANPRLVDCYRPPLILPRGQKTRQWIVPENQRSGAVGNVKTIYEGVGVVSYWNGLRDAVLEERGLRDSSEVVDFSSWYQVQARRFGWDGGRKKSPYYYCALMGLYASGRAVLYTGPPVQFTSDITAPTAKFAQENLGVRPLIVQGLLADRRDWSDLSFLDKEAVENLRTYGTIDTKETT